MANTKTLSPATKLALANSKLAQLRSEGPVKKNKRRGLSSKRRSGSGTTLLTQELMTATVLGWLQSAGHLANVPTIAVLGTEGTIALVGYLWSRNGGPPLAGTIARVAGVVAANHFGRTSLDTIVTAAIPDAPAAPAAAPRVQGYDDVAGEYDVGYDVGYDD
jgi:hypothetical protein